MHEGVCVKLGLFAYLVTFVFLVVRVTLKKIILYKHR